MNPINHSSTQAIARQSFEEMIAMLDHSDGVSVDTVEPDYIQSLDFSTVMFTIASSMFKVNVLLHYCERNESVDSFSRLTKFDATKNIEQQYRDYISEIGNNLCGSATRMIGNTGFSTGMSTPVMLKIHNSTQHMGVVLPSSEAHIGCMFNGNPLIYASFYLVINNDCQDMVEIKISESKAESDNSGELEFF